jgi:hypothetical protein
LFHLIDCKEATGVDDLYRIAEIWVNPPAYFETSRL